MDARTEHIGNISIQGDMNSNKMERLNVEILDSVKVISGLNRKDTPVYLKTTKYTITTYELIED